MYAVFHYAIALQRILCLPSDTQGYLKNTGVAEHNDTSIGTRLDVIVRVSFSVEVCSYFVSRYLQFGCYCIHTTMRKTVFHLTQAIKCCTNHICY